MRRRLARLGKRIGNDIVLSGGAGILIGLFAIREGYSYGIGSASRMAPGYFPAIVGGFMILLGIALILIGLYREQHSRLALPALRSILTVLLAMAAFGLLIESAGLVPATVAMTLISSTAEPGRRLVPTLLLAAALTVFAVSVFVLGLNLPITVIRWPF